jgi:uncharacterized protein
MAILAILAARMKILRNRLAVCVLGSALAALGLLAGAGEALSWPATRPIGGPPADLHAEHVLLRLAPAASNDGHAACLTAAAWFARGRTGAGAVLLLHGVRADRRAMLARARFLQRAGYAVMLMDLPSHGESSGDRITFGWREADGVTAAMIWLRSTLPGEKIGVIGVSLGAAALVFSGQRPDAAVLESMYPTIKEAVEDRLQARFGVLGRAAAPLLLWQLPVRLGIGAGQLVPIARMGRFAAPVLIASGSADQHTTEAETRRIFGAAREPKQLWLAEGAAHVDLHAFGGAEYEKVVGAFLASHLQ